MKKTKIISFAAALTAAVSAVSYSSTTLSANAEFKTSHIVTLWGDANCDGVVDLMDIALIEKQFQFPNKEIICDLGRANADVFLPGTGITKEDTDAIASYYQTIFSGGQASLPIIAADDTRYRVWGDVNCDGEVSLLDCVCLQQYLANLTKYPLKADGLLNADVYQPGSGITLMDQLVLQQYTVGNLDTLPQYVSFSEPSLGDINGDKSIDSADASAILVEYTYTMNGRNTTLTKSQRRAADVSGDNTVDSSDASIVLEYYCYLMSSPVDPKSLDYYIKR